MSINQINRNIEQDLRDSYNHAELDAQRVVNWVNTRASQQLEATPMPNYIVGKSPVIRRLKLLLRTAKLQNVDFELTRASKVAPQGGTFDQTTFEQSWDTYYNIPVFDESVIDEMYYSASDLSALMTLQYPHHYIIESWSELYRCYKGDHRSIGGVTAMEDRRHLFVRQTAIQQAGQNPFEADPAIHGMRLKYKKYRDIFMDSFANQFRAMRVLYRTFETIKQLATDDEETLQFRVGSLKNIRSGLATDQTAMDKHIWYQKVRAYLPLMARMFRWTDVEQTEIDWFLESYMRSALVTTKGVIYGEHSMFSGLYITHDIENILSLLTAYTVVYQWLVDNVSHSYASAYGTEWVLLVSGDDVTILFSKSFTRDHLKTLAVRLEQFYNRAAFEMNAEKQDIFTDAEGKTHWSFCKKYFPLPTKKKAGKIVHYASAVLSLNNICWPEKFHSLEQGYGLIKLMICQICDACSGNPLFNMLLDIITDVVDPVILTYDVTDDDLQAFHDRNLTWEEAVWNATYDYANSPTRQGIANKLALRVASGVDLMQRFTCIRNSDHEFDDWDFNVDHLI